MSDQAEFFGIAVDASHVVVACAHSNCEQPGMAEVDAATYEQARTMLGSATWDGKTLQPYTPPAPPVSVPVVVTRLQGRLALSRAGLLTKAEAAVAAAGGETAIWYADAQTWQRDDPHVLAIGQALGLASADIDTLFTAAAAI